MRIESLISLFHGTRHELINWMTTAPLGALVSPNRYLPDNNLLMRSRFGRRRMVLRTRSGVEIECRANEFPPFLEAFVMRTYDIPDYDWPSVRTIVDVGANVGMATLWLAQQAPQARILAIEPSPDAARTLRVNIARNSLEDRITVVETALGLADGEAMLDTSGPSVNGHVRGSGPGLLVPVTTLGAVLGRHQCSAVDILKLDCEGAEYDILEGAREALGGVRRVIGEYHAAEGRSPDALRTLLEAAGLTVELFPDDSGGVGTFRARRDDTPASVGATPALRRESAI